MSNIGLLAGMPEQVLWLVNALPLAAEKKWLLPISSADYVLLG